MSKSEYSYQDALRLLKSRRRQQRPSIRATVSNRQLRGTPASNGMRLWLNQIGHTDTVIDELRVIHVAGTKGKGSTCAFAEAFLKAHHDRTGFPSKHGLYTSPALQEETERIRINSKQISKADFTKNVFEVWNKLEYGNPEEKPLPRYLQLMFLVSLHTFIKEDVNIAIVETHHGGQFDSTNILPRPAATCVTSLGFDHVAQLGPTISDIAWHKSGIFKEGSPAFTVDNQPEDARSVLIDRARDAKTELRFVSNDPALPSDHTAIGPEVQRLNCSMAKTLVNAYLAQDAPGELQILSEQDTSAALDNIHIRGRFEYVNDGRVSWYLDGAHNAMSIDNPVQWFSQATKRSPLEHHDLPKTSDSDASSFRILAFSHISKERDGEEVLEALVDSIRRHQVTFDRVIFCYDGLREDGSIKQDMNFGTETDESRYAHIWEGSSLAGNVTNTATIDETVQIIENARSVHEHVHVLVTGSFHLVGGILSRVNPV